MTPPAAPRLRLTFLLLAAGIAGSLDLAFAIAWAELMFAVPPDVVLQVIASGILGPSAIGSGWLASLSGLILHFGIMGVFAAFAWWSVCHLPLNGRAAVAAGLAYGAGLFVVMNYAVVPASLAPLPLRTTWSSIIPELIAHMVLVGLPLVWLARREIRNYRR